MIRNLQKPIEFEKETVIHLKDRVLYFAGPKGKIELGIASSCLKININESDSTMDLSAPIADISSKERAVVGTTRALIRNCIKGVFSGHQKTVIFTGTGVSVQIIGNTLVMKIGKSHPVIRDIPNNVKCVIKSSDIKTLSLGIESVDKAAVGQFSRDLCDLSKNKYKGGIHIWIEGKEPKLKEGKK